MSKILKCGTEHQWLNTYGLFVIRPNLHGYLLICYVVDVFGRFARETNHGAGERFSVFVVWFENLSTFALEMGVLDANLVITWSRNPHAKTSIPKKPSTSVLIGV